MSQKDLKSILTLIIRLTPEHILTLPHHFCRMSLWHQHLLPLNTSAPAKRRGTAGRGGESFGGGGQTPKNSASGTPKNNRFWTQDMCGFWVATGVPTPASHQLALVSINYQLIQQIQKEMVPKLADHAFYFPAEIPTTCKV